MLFNGKRVRVRSLKRAEDILWRKGIGKNIQITMDFYDYKDFPVAHFWSYVNFLEWVNNKGIFGHFNDIAEAIKEMKKLGNKFNVTHFNINS